MTTTALRTLKISFAANIAAFSVAPAVAALAPLEQTRAGDPDFDYALGLGAAKAGFDTVIADPSLPDPVRQQLNSLSRRYRTQLQGGYDSNVNAATSATSITLPVFAFLGPATLGGGATRKGEAFGQTAALAQTAGQAATSPAVLLSTGMQAGGATMRAGDLLAGEAEIMGGITQLRTADGDTISIVGDSRITSSNGEVTLQRGRFTVVAGPDGVANVRVAGDMLVTVNGQNASASLAVDPAGLLTGRGLGGTISVTAGGVTRSFDVGEAFRAALDQAPTRTLAVGV